MDAIAPFAAGNAAPADVAPSLGAVPGDAFTAAFAAAMEAVPAVDLPGIALPAVDLPVVLVTPVQTTATPSLATEDVLPLVVETATAVAGAEAPVASAKPSTPARAETLPAETRPESRAQPSESEPVREAIEPPEPVEPPADGAARPAEGKEASERPTNRRAKARAESPPLAQAPATLEKEAPTTAPNAPVPPLDRSSESPTSEDDGEPAVATAAQNASAPKADAPVRSKRPKAAPVMAGAAPSPGATAPTPPEVPVPVVASTSKVAPSSATFAMDSVDAPTVSEFTPVFAAHAVAEPATKAPTPALASAPDLDAVPLVLAASLPTTPSVPVAVPIAPVASMPVPPAVPNEQIARVAAERTTSPASAPAEKPAPKPLDAKAVEAKTAVLPIEAAVTQGEKAQGDDAPADDAPPQPTPTAQDAPRTVATERPDPGVDRPSVDRHLVVRQVADRIESLVAARSKDGVTVHLEPRDLGTITLVVRGLSSALDVQVTASDDRVRQGLDASRPDLAQALAPRGIELRELRVAVVPSAASGGAGANAGSGGRPSPEGQARQPAPAPSFVKASRSEARVSRATRSSGRGVDLLV